MNICNVCNDDQNNQIPLLVCGCYCCSECYCKLKSSGINNCITCKKPLRRSSRRNKIQNEIYKLNILYSA